MSKKVILKKLAQMAKWGGKSKGATPVTKGVIIGEKCQRDETLDILPTNKGK